MYCCVWPYCSLLCFQHPAAAAVDENPAAAAATADAEAIQDHCLYLSVCELCISTLPSPGRQNFNVTTGQQLCCSGCRCCHRCNTTISYCTRKSNLHAAEAWQQWRQEGSHASRGKHDNARNSVLPNGQFTNTSRKRLNSLETVFRVGACLHGCVPTSVTDTANCLPDSTWHCRSADHAPGLSCGTKHETTVAGSRRIAEFV